MKAVGFGRAGCVPMQGPSCQLLIVPCQIDLSINEFAGTLLLFPVRGKGPYFKWGRKKKS